MTTRSFSCQILIVLLIICWFIPSQALALQSKPVYVFEKVDVGQMLGRSHVLKVVQDHEGFIWAATQDGLYRYDGYQLKAFRHDPDNPASLPDNYILSLFVDSQGVLWVATAQRGIARFHPETGEFTRFSNQPNNPQSLAHNMVFGATEGPHGDIWIATFGGGLNRLNRKNGTIKRYQHDKQDPHSISDNRVTSVLRDDKGNIWGGTLAGGMNLLNVDSGQFSQIPLPTGPGNNQKHRHVLAILQDSTNTVWASTGAGGLSRYNPQSQRFEAIQLIDDNDASISSHIIYDLAEDKSGTIWMASRYGGLLRLNNNRNQLLNYRHQPQLPHSLVGNNLFSLSVDNTGIVWLSMFNDGLTKFDPASERFGKVAHDPNDPHSINNGNISSFWLDDHDNLWIGSDQGLSKRDHQTGRFSHYRHQEDKSDSLSDNDVETVYQDSTGTLWVGTQKGGLNRLNEDASDFTHYRHDIDIPYSLPSDAVLAISEDSQNNLWLGTSNGLARFDRTTQKFTRFAFSEDDTTSVSSDAIYHISTTKDGNLWIGTGNGGFNRFNKETQSFTRYMHKGDNANSLSNNRVFTIHEDGDGILWLGTAGGLNRFDPVTGQFRHFREKDGLINDAVFNISDDASGNLWLGLGEKSIALFNKQNFDIRNDLGQEANCAANQNALHKAADGRLYFGTKGYCAFYPDKVLQHSLAPKMAFTEFYLLHNQVVPNQQEASAILKTSINHTEAITLSHLDNVFSFEFAALHFAAPKRNKYRYQLLGFDQDWITTDAKNRRATYTNLPAGNYTFKVQGSNHEGTWSEQTSSLSVTVEPAPWRTWWAYSLYLALALAFIGTIAHQRHLKRQALILAKNNAELAKRNAEKANQAKTLFVADISHEIRTPLNAVMGYTQMLEQDPTLSDFHKRKLSIIEKSSNHLLGLINNILDISKIEADAMVINDEHFELVDMLRGIVLMLTIRSDNQDLSMVFDNQAQVAIPVLADQGKLRQILINLLANAVKFTHRGKVTLTLSSPQPNHYTFAVSDTGIGIDKANHNKVFEAFGQTEDGVKKGGTGLGLAIAYKQVELLGGQLQLESTLGQGSCFYFTVPLKPSGVALGEQATPVNTMSKLIDGHKLSAMVVDDSLESVELLSDLLEQMGLSVITANNGQQALQLLQDAEKRPNIIFTDIKMPVMDGPALLEAVQKHFGDDAPVCVAVSAHAMTQDIQRYSQLGFADYITKPYKFDSIYQCIEQLPGVQFESDESPQTAKLSEVDLEQLKVPAHFLQRIRTVAADYEITLLEECMTELADHCEQGRLLSEGIRPYLSNYDMDGLLAALERVEGEDA